MTSQEIVDALEAGTLNIEPQQREILQALAAVVNGSADAGYVEIVDSLEAGTLVIEPSYQDTLQALAAVANGSADAGYVAIVDALETGALNVPRYYRSIYQAIAEIINGATPATPDIEFIADGANFTGFGLAAPVGVDNITVDWGDGNTEDFSGDGNTNELTHTYADSDPYTVKVYVTGATEFKISSNDSFGSDDSVAEITTLPSTLTEVGIYAQGGLVSADLSTIRNCTSIDFYGNTSFNQAVDFSVFTNCTSFNFSNNTSFNQAVDFSVFTNCTSFNFYGNASFNQAVDFSAFTNCASFEFSGNTSFTNAFSISGLTAISGLYAGGNKLTVTEVNNALIELDTNGIEDGEVDLSGQTPAAAPTGAGATAATNLIGKGWDVTVDS